VARSAGSATTRGLDAYARAIAVDRSRKRFDERAFLLRHLEIQTALALRFTAEASGEPKEPENTTP
jgi:hypothetical protein